MVPRTFRVCATAPRRRTFANTTVEGGGTYKLTRVGNALRKSLNKPTRPHQVGAGRHRCERRPKCAVKRTNRIGMDTQTAILPTRLNGTLVQPTILVYIYVYKSVYVRRNPVGNTILKNTKVVAVTFLRARWQRDTYCGQTSSVRNGGGVRIVPTYITVSFFLICPVSAKTFNI